MNLVETGNRLIDESKVQFREYQVRIAENILKNGNSLVILPTGLGKTIVALLVVERKLLEGKRVLFLAPTRPLAEQHQKTISSLLKIPVERTALLTGTIQAEKRASIWSNAFIVCATPQTIENDIRAGRISLDGFGLCVVDECHRSVKRYAYTFVAEECKRKGVQLLGLTASPGGKKERIEAVTKALDVKHIEIRTEADEDVAPYVKRIETKWVEVELPAEFSELKKKLEEVISERLEPLAKMHVVNTTNPKIPKRLILEAGKKLAALPDSNKLKFVMLSHYATVMNLTHALELLETQGISTFLSFLKKLEAREQKSMAVKRILGDARIRWVMKRAEELSAKGEHPKLAKLVEIVRERKGKKIIIFVQFRNQIKRIVDELAAHGFSARQFIGRKEGVTLKEQKETIQRFREGEFDIMVASSIGEEGLDIPSVDSVIFYEPVPSEIRLIQRRGRAGRAKSGEVVFLITRGTRDEAYYWASKSREAKMKRIVKGIQAQLAVERVFEKHAGHQESGKDAARLKPGQARMTDFF